MVGIGQLIVLLFFKAIYRDLILRGEKTDTIRRPIRLPRVGSLVKACVGPSRIFATLRVLEVTPIGSLTPERAAQVLACYPDVTPDMVRLRFELVADHHVPDNSAH
jgi:hypothetical protein